MFGSRHFTRTIYLDCGFLVPVFTSFSSRHFFRFYFSDLRLLSVFLWIFVFFCIAVVPFLISVPFITVLALSVYVLD